MKKVIKKKIKNTTLDDLARMMQAGFSEMVTKTEFDARFQQVDARFGQIDARFQQVDVRFEQIKSELWYVRNHIDLIEKEITSIKAELKNVVYKHELEALELRVVTLEKILQKINKK